MIRALTWRNLRQHALLLSILFLSMILLEFFLVWVAVQMNIGPEFQRFLEGFLPSEVTEMIFGQFGLTTFEGAVAFGYQHPFSLVASIVMVTVAATLPAAERERGYLEVFLSHPVPRARYLLSTLIFVVLVSLAMPLGLLIGTALGLKVVESPSGLSWTEYVPAAGALALLLLAIGGYTLLLATGSHRRGIATAQGVAFTLLFYWLDFMGGYWQALAYARRASPFFYYDPARASVGSGISPMEIGILGGITVTTSLLAFLNFERQEL